MQRNLFGRALWILVALGLALPASAARVKDMAHLSGVRDNDLTGYGLVVGLHGSFRDLGPAVGGGRGV